MGRALSPLPTALAVRVLPGLAPSSPQAFVTRRRPLAPPMYLYSVLLCGGGGPQGGRALWALTFYNPNLGLPTREGRPMERLVRDDRRSQDFTLGTLLVLRTAVEIPSPKRNANEILSSCLSVLVV